MMKRLLLNSGLIALSVALVGLADAVVRVMTTGTALPIEQLAYGLVFLIPIYLLVVLPGTLILDVLLAQSGSPRSLAIVLCTAAGLALGVGLSIVGGDIRPTLFLGAIGLSSGFFVRPPVLLDGAKTRDIPAR
jgi:hypothetical protein